MGTIGDYWREHKEYNQNLKKEKGQNMTNDLVKTDQVTDLELHQRESQAMAMADIQGAIVVAKQFPRNDKVVWEKCLQACQRRTLAENAEYSFPRSGQKITGPSVNLARAIAQKYGNIRYGLDILRDDEDRMQIRGWAWDIETNTKVSADDSFKKLVYRKKGGWIKPDERDLRELIFRRGAILIRNALLQVMPVDLTEDCIVQCHKTIRDNIADPKKTEKDIIKAFSNYGVTVEMINGYLGHEVWTKDDMVDLINVGNSIRDGQAKVAEFFDLGPSPQTSNGSGKPAEGQINPETDMKPGDKKKHQGYDTETGQDKPETATGEEQSPTEGEDTKENDNGASQGGIFDDK